MLCMICGWMYNVPFSVVNIVLCVLRRPLLQPQIRRVHLVRSFWVYNIIIIVGPAAEYYVTCVCVC